MRHQKSGRKLGRTSAHRKAMFRNMVTSLLEHGSIRTTDARAKELRKIADRMVTLGKRQTVHARRHAARTIRSGAVLHKLFAEIADGFSERQGGYTRIIKLGNRRGDNAPLSIIELMPFGAPETKQRSRPVAPKVTKRAAVPETKERFDLAEEAPVEEIAAAEEAPVEEIAAAEVAPVEEIAAAEEAPVEKVAAEEAPVEEIAAAEEAPVEKVAAAEEAPVEEAPVAEEADTENDKA